MLTLVKKNECYESCNCLSYTQKLHPQISSLALFVSKKNLKGLRMISSDPPFKDGNAHFTKLLLN